MRRASSAFGLLLALSIVCEGCSGSSAATPAGIGSHTVTSSMETVAGRSVVVFDPAMPAGERAPLVLFKHGFQLSTMDYETTLTQLASHGYVVVGVDTAVGIVGAPTQLEERDAMIAVLDWSAGASAPFADHVDAEHVAVMGHSRGGMVAVMVAAADARIDAMLGLDPVNACGPGMPYSASCPDVTTAGFAPSLDIPAGYMGETADGTGGFMPCAPLAQNYATIYDATTSASWSAEWTFAGAAHMTFTDDGGGVFGSLCASASGNEVLLRDEIRTLAVAFLDRHLRGDASRDAWLTGGSVPADVTLRHR